MNGPRWESGDLKRGGLKYEYTLLKWDRDKNGWGGAIIYL